jgi:hypothetical protein
MNTATRSVQHLPHGPALRIDRLSAQTIADHNLPPHTCTRLKSPYGRAHATLLPAAATFIHSFLHSLVPSLPPSRSLPLLTLFPRPPRRFPAVEPLGTRCYRRGWRFEICAAVARTRLRVALFALRTVDSRHAPCFPSLHISSLVRRALYLQTLPPFLSLLPPSLPPRRVHLRRYAVSRYIA